MPNNIKISVITWDSSFRESFHTVDSFCKQDYDAHRYEFIWTEYYSQVNPYLANKIRDYPNARILCLGEDKKSQWHLGKCLNAGIQDSKGDILVIVDGDVIVPSHLLSIVDNEHQAIEDLALYFRRWDEGADQHNATLSYDTDYLDKVCVMNTATNYAACLSIKKKHLLEVNGYEEAPTFSGPGMSGTELYTRLRNRGYAVKWQPSIKIFHPYHESTGTSSADKAELSRLRSRYSWVLPYAGLEQSWVVKCREKDLTFKAGEKSVADYLTTLPRMNKRGFSFLNFYLPGLRKALGRLHRY